MQRSSGLVLLLVSGSLLLSILALIGHVAGIPLLASIQAGYRVMSTLTATAAIVLALGLLCASAGRQRLGVVAGGAAMIAALAVLASYALAGDDLVSPWWASNVFGLSTELGRTSRSTAAAIGLIALTLLVRQRPKVVDLSAGAALILSTIALLGYVYGVRDLYALLVFNNMALNTAAALFLLSIAALCVEPAMGWSAIVASQYAIGGATRRQLFFCLVPAIIGWLMVRALEAHWLGAAAAMALLVAGTIVPLALLILRDGKRLLGLELERRIRAEQLAAAAADAERRLAAQAVQLAQESAERAKAEEGLYRAQRLEAIGKLTGGIAHDFNNLLMVLSGNVQLLKKRLPSADPLRRYVDNMGVAVAKGSKVTQQLLAFSRSQRLDIKPTLIEAVVVEARQLLGSSLGPRISVDMRLQAENAWALCDDDQLELALLNLAVNSRDAMPEGGTLTVACSTSEMLDAPRRGTACVMVQVADTGAGMPSDVIAHAGEPFFTTKEAGKGTGLGLAQVYGFVAQCKGELRILSAPGAGTTVELRFPQVPAPDEGLEARPEAPTSADHRKADGKHRRVIVIDDDDGVREVIVQALIEAGYEVTAAIDGRTGLAELANFEPAAAVIDFLMPGMHGADVARAAQLRYPGLPIIFVSGYADTAALEGVSGASVLRKPFEMSTLTRMVEDAIGK